MVLVWEWPVPLACAAIPKAWHPGFISHAAAKARVIVYVKISFSSRRRHTRYWRDWSSDVCSSDLSGRFPHHRVSVFCGSRSRVATRLPSIAAATAMLREHPVLPTPPLGDEARHILNG